MKTQLIPLQTGHLSLEIPLKDMEYVRNAIIARWGKFESEQRVNYEVVIISGSEFVSEAEYDEVCLISGDDDGDSILSEINRFLG